MTMLLLTGCFSLFEDAAQRELRDRDGDGWNANVDCNDGDPNVHPFAVEIWYDGFDENCDGWDDWDADGDGWAANAGDCNDADAGQHPGRDEVWYDGVDQDCDGGTDLDADADGFYAIRSGGSDCDDFDAEVNPDAEEIWYDTIDQNCDGNDRDRDGDGQDAQRVGGLDCNDVDPELPALWYHDIDRDGVGGRNTGIWSCWPPGYASRVGGDCNDFHPGVHPGEVEICDDGLDNDCDPTTVCDLDEWDSFIEVEADVTLTGSADGDRFSSALATGDLDGDGFLDLIVGAYGAGSDSEGEVGVYLGPSISTADLEFTGGAAKARAGRAVATGDLDGDGEDELLIGIPFSDLGGQNSGEVVVVEPGDAGTLDGAFDRIVGVSEDERLGRSVVVADLDGDGLVEVVAGAPESGIVRIADAELDELAALAGEREFGAGLGTADLDGDGTAELLVGGGGAVHVFAAPWTAAHATLEGAGGDAVLGMDVDYDAFDDLVVGAPEDDATYVIYGPTTGTLRVDEVLRGTGRGRDGTALVACDLSGDGVAERVGGAPDEAGSSKAGAVVISEGSRDWRLYGTTGGAGHGSSLGCADLNADGVDDLVIGAPQDAAGSLFLLWGMTP